jgi:hypothetical protein
MPPPHLYTDMVARSILVAQAQKLRETMGLSESLGVREYNPVPGGRPNEQCKISGGAFDNAIDDWWSFDNAYSDLPYYRSGRRGIRLIRR